MTCERFWETWGYILIGLLVLGAVVGLAWVSTDYIALRAKRAEYESVIERQKEKEAKQQEERKKFMGTPPLAHFDNYQHWTTWKNDGSNSFIMIEFDNGQKLNLTQELYRLFKKANINGVFLEPKKEKPCPCP